MSVHVVDERERLARAALSRIGEPGDRELSRLVRAEGPVAVLEAMREGTLSSRRLPSYAARARAVRPDRDLAAAASAGIQLICPGEVTWPTQLDQLDVPPLALWVRGEPDLRHWALRSLAVVGARACTAYGTHVATELGAVLAERGWTVVSGAAFGIDVAAHRGALAVEGQTVAVLACGVDVPYPRAHEALLARILEEGLIVSELPPGSSVTKGRFLERNRVIAALTRGTVVVEAAVRSGALSTAGHAGGLGRQVMAVPGPVTSALSAGCHELIRTQGANLVTDAADVLDVVGSLGADEAPRRRGEDRPGDGLDPEAARVLDALPARRTTSVDRLTVVAGLAVPEVLRGLGVLADLGLAECKGGQWRLAPRRATASAAAG